MTGINATTNGTGNVIVDGTGNVTGTVTLAGSNTLSSSSTLTIGSTLGVSGAEAPRRKAVEDRLKGHPVGVVPARGKLPDKERFELFRTMVEAAAGTVEEIPRAADVPDFATLEAHLADTQERVRRCFERIVGEVG